MIILGNPESEHQGHKCELRFFKGSDLTATVYTDCLKKFEVTRSIQGFALGVFELRMDSGSGIGGLREQERFEVWVDSPRHDEMERLAVLRVEYCELEFDEAEATLEIHGRSPAAALVDDPWEFTFVGRLEVLLQSGCDASGVPVELSDIDDKDVVAYVRCPSTYGALRLIANSCDAIMADDMDGVRIEAVRTARARLERDAAVTLGPDELISGKLTQGRRPVKQRS